MRRGGREGGSAPPGSAFADGKAPQALRTIGEVCQALGLKPHLLRYWEEQFPMLQPLRRRGGRRLYRPEDVALIQRIDHLLHCQGYTIKGARQLLGMADLIAAPGGRADSAAVMRQGLAGLRDRLARALERDAPSRP